MNRKRKYVLGAFALFLINFGYIGFIEFTIRLWKSGVEPNIPLYIIGIMFWCVGMALILSVMFED